MNTRMIKYQAVFICCLTKFGVGFLVPEKS